MAAGYTRTNLYVHYIYIYGIWLAAFLPVGVNTSEPFAVNNMANYMDFSFHFNIKSYFEDPNIDM